MTGLLNPEIFGTQINNRPFCFGWFIVLYPSHGIFHPVAVLFFFFTQYQFLGEVFNAPTLRGSIRKKKVMRLSRSMRRM